MSESTVAIVRGALILVTAFAGLVGFVIWTIKKSRDPGTILRKWIASLPVFALIAVSIAWLGPVGPFVIVFCAIILSLLWTPHLGAALASPLTSLFDGGNVEVEPQPFYSIARARMKQGKYAEALALVREQLAKFPKDLEGHMLVAEIQAESLDDVEGAEQTIQRFVSQPGHTAKSICYALYALVDWKLKYRRDREGASAALRQVQELLPNTEYALNAAQRLAHLSGPELPTDFREKRFAVPESQPFMRRAQDHAEPVKPTDATPENEAASLVEHVEAHPYDAEARENLSRLYAEQFARPDLAIEQLEFLIHAPQQSAKQVVRWLNMIADIQVRAGEPEDIVQSTLQRIIDQGPGGASADQARSRLALLRLELKGKQKGQAVKLGTYEQNLGLKGRLPRHEL